MSKILVIGHVWPEPASSAAGSRMMQLLEFFISEKYEVVFATSAVKSKNMADLDSLGIRTEIIKLNHSSFDELLKRLKPNAVMFDRFMTEEQFGWRVDEHCPDALKILDTEDLHFLRKAREKAQKKGVNAEDIYFEEDITLREISAIYRCDLSLIISEAEFELLAHKFGIPKNILFYLPYLLEGISEAKINELPAFEERKNFITIGNFLHEPNWDAINYLKEKIWPGIRKKLPEAEMHIYGAYVTQKALQLNNKKDGFLIKGWAEDAANTQRNARLCIAPLRFGAGLKGKLIEAMLNGTPSVTTAIGAEGINEKLPWNGFISEEPKEIIDKSIQLYSDKNLWLKSQQQGYEIINTRFRRKEHEENLRNRLNEIKDDLKAHRTSNFTGKMLKHHLHRSTYFMSRFIEEKNKK